MDYWQSRSLLEGRSRTASTAAVRLLQEASMAHLILYTDANFRGAHKHVLDKVDALSLLGTDSQGHTICVADCDFPNGVSSIVILSGNWQFSRGEKQQDPYPVILGPGLY